VAPPGDQSFKYQVHFFMHCTLQSLRATRSKDKDEKKLQTRKGFIRILYKDKVYALIHTANWPANTTVYEVIITLCNISLDLGKLFYH
jgi:hypothetical protein